MIICTLPCHDVLALEGKGVWTAGDRAEIPERVITGIIQYLHILTSLL